MKPTKQQAQLFFDTAFSFANNLKEDVEWNMQINRYGYMMSYHAEDPDTGWAYNGYFSRHYCQMADDENVLTDEENLKGITAIFAEALTSLQKANLLK